MATLSDVVDFLREEGLLVEWQLEARGFLPKCLIERGVLLVDPQCPVSDVLHEAGHLAILPAQFRAGVTGDVDSVCDDMAAALCREPADSLLSRAILQASDPEATAWAWAVGLHLGLRPKVVIADSEYDDGGKAQRTMLSLCQHTGIHGLAHAGWCQVRLNPCNPAPVWGPSENKASMPSIFSEANPGPIRRVLTGLICGWTLIQN